MVWKLVSILLALEIVIARAEVFRAVNPKLKAEVQLDSDSFWHLGGFCFGHDREDREVALLKGRVEWDGQVPLHKAQVYVAGYDGRADVWGEARRRWNSSSCEEKLQVASSYLQLTSHYDRGHRGTFGIRILQGTGTRDWHFVLLSCGNVEQATLKLKLEAEEGALSIFEANSQFYSSSCPSFSASSWWQTASSQLGFWTFMILSVFLTSCCTLLVSCFVRRLRFAGVRKDVENTEVDATAAAEVVVGRPCEMASAEIVTGLPHGKV